MGQLNEEGTTNKGKRGAPPDSPYENFISTKKNMNLENKVAHKNLCDKSLVLLKLPLPSLFMKIQDTVWYFILKELAPKISH